MKRIAVFASGNGSNFQAICDAAKEGRLDAEPVLVVCDKAGAFVLERAAAEGVDAFTFSAKDYPDKASYEQEILRRLNEYRVDFIILAGYMRLIGPTLIQPYAERIVNIHPSLLPAFPGKDAVGQSLQAGVKVTGLTIHYVDEGMDTGPILAQQAVPVLDGDTRDSLQERIQKKEHELYPEVLQQLFRKKQHTY
ncbi:phosphoribosylglycinamide formyltransferase [Bacillus massiliglaciei]|uniref:phosphoribosylglycinamide formyltransferase n=1 Tax=Bacillus massiliglaciei TaxID=1816693 RepID=UPI000AD6D6D0|nr:phosphoribosylglycinamide formyltransferase [Bacillus massiliglaciei]